eukprot:TRINITY_DN4100_c0_g1_i2.p1 TRINITY_DN4100_c0_g1~~TRINITY_DN4100_c0_g1_i2.p1  ORF type:complete len:440 (-),score=13.47 TRINITY_DN4100_c0_g1_i2:268-1587(-)
MEDYKPLLERKIWFPSPSVKFLPFDCYLLAIGFFCCWITFGSNVFYGMPGTLQTQLAAYFAESRQLTELDNIIFYSVTTFPNTIFPILTGYLVDRFVGVRFGSFLFSALVLAGSSYFSYSVEFKQYYDCILGRLIFGLGMDSLMVTQLMFIVRWFSDKKLSFVMSLAASCSKLGSSLNFLTLPILASFSVPVAMWAGTAVCLSSFLFYLVMLFLDWYGNSRLEGFDYLKRVEEDELFDIASGKKLRPKKKIHEESLTCADVFNTPLSIWVIYLVNSLFYTTISTFLATVPTILKETERFSEFEGVLYSSIPVFVLIAFGPFVGLLLDRTKAHFHFMVLGTFLLVVGQILFVGEVLQWFVISKYPYLPVVLVMILIGLANVFFTSSVYPYVSMNVERPVLGSGKLTLIQYSIFSSKFESYRLTLFEFYPLDKIKFKFFKC